MQIRLFLLLDLNIWTISDWIKYERMLTSYGDCLFRMIAIKRREILSRTGGDWEILLNKWFRGDANLIFTLFWVNVQWMIDKSSFSDLLYIQNLSKNTFLWAFHIPLFTKSPPKSFLNQRHHLLPNIPHNKNSFIKYPCKIIIVLFNLFFWSLFYNFPPKKTSIFHFYV